MILFTSISGFINGIAVIIFGLLVLFHNPKGKVNRLMVLACISISFWAISWGVGSLMKGESSSLFWMRMLNFGAVFIPILFSHWVLALLEIEKEKKNKVVLILGYLLSVFFAISVFTSYFVSVKPKPYFYYYSEPEFLHPFYLIFCYFGLVSFAFYKLIKSYKKADGYKKAQIKYVLLGSILGFGGGATNYFLFYNIPIPPFGNPLVAVGFSILTYAVVRYRLMDIKVVIGKGIAYAFSFLTIIAIALLLVYYNNQLNNPLSVVVLVPFIAVLSILLFQIHKFYEEITEQYFSRSFYNTKIKIADLEERLTQVLELETLSYLLSNTLKNIFDLDKLAIITKNEKDGEYIIQEALNYNKKKLSSFLKEQNLEKEKKILTKQEFKNLEKINTEVFIPLIFKKQIIGMIFLGNKKSGQAFSVQDLKLLKELSCQVSIVLKNASLFAEINKRREELERFYRLTIEKEQKMLELKKRVRELEEKLRSNKK